MYCLHAPFTFPERVCRRGSAVEDTVVYDISYFTSLDEFRSICNSQLSNITCVTHHSWSCVYCDLICYSHIISYVCLPHIRASARYTHLVYRDLCDDIDVDMCAESRRSAARPSSTNLMRWGCLCVYFAIRGREIRFIVP